MTTDEAKAIPEAALRALVRGPWRSVPLRHQLATVAWLADLPAPRACVWSDIGTGKSAAALYAHLWWGFRRLLIVCPNSVRESWLTEIQTHTNRLPIVLTGPMLVRKNLLQGAEDGIFIVNWEGLKLLFAARHDRKYDTADPAALAAAVAEVRVDALVLDESHCLGSPTTHQSRIAAELARQADKVLLLTGTPFTADERELWHQLWCMDPAWAGRAVGRSPGSFCGRWMEGDPASMIWNRKIKRSIAARWRVREDRRIPLMAALAERTIRYDREECCDLPGRTYTTRHCDLTAEQVEAIDAVVAGEDWLAPDGKTVGKRVMAAGDKLSQIAGGVLLDKKSGAKRFLPNPKLDLLAEVLAGLGRRKTVVYHAYVEEGRAIEDRLRSLGVGHASLRGEVPEAARVAGLAAYRGDPACRVLVAHPRSGGVGLNLQGAADAMVFYSCGGLGAAGRDQAEGRIWRQGQTRPCLFVDLVARGSMDQDRLRRLGDRRATVAAVLEYLAARKSLSNKE